MRSRTIFFAAICAAVLFSCSTPRYAYSPSQQNVPVLVKQGDSKLSASYSSDLSGYGGRNGSGEVLSKSDGFDVQGAVAVTDHFALQANYFNRVERNGGDDDFASNAVIDYRRELAELGIGFIDPLNERKTVIFQLFGGVGKGRFSFTDHGTLFNDTAYNRHHRSDITRIYIQPAMMFRKHENFVLSVSSRLSIVKFGNIKTDYTFEELSHHHLDGLGSGARTFWEPAFTNNFGFKKLPGIRFEYQVALSLLISRRQVDYRPFNFSIGMMFDLPKLFRGNSGE